MSNRRNKWYVVWVGQEPGVYDSWSECQEQIHNFPGARYKSFSSQDEAVAAYRGRMEDHLNLVRQIVSHTPKPKVIEPGGYPDYTVVPGINLNAIAVDGACAGNPGVMEYRAVRVIDGSEVFHIGAKKNLIGTNNIAEYIGMIHLAAMLAAQGDFSTPIYTDSRNTLAWLRRGHSRTSLGRDERTAPALDLLARADAWLAANGPISNPILKWQTDLWGEIPADFGRKG